MSQKTLSRKTFKTQMVSIGLALRGIRKAKESATGATFTRLHRIESMLVTTQGRKPPRRDIPKKGKPKGGKSKKR